MTKAPERYSTKAVKTQFEELEINVPRKRKSSAKRYYLK